MISKWSDSTQKLERRKMQRYPAVKWIGVQVGRETFADTLVTQKSFQRDLYQLYIHNDLLFNTEEYYSRTTEHTQKLSISLMCPSVSLCLFQLRERIGGRVCCFRTKSLFALIYPTHRLRYTSITMEINIKIQMRTCESRMEKLKGL